MDKKYLVFLSPVCLLCVFDLGVFIVFPLISVFRPMSTLMKGIWRMLLFCIPHLSCEFEVARFHCIFVCWNYHKFDFYFILLRLFLEKLPTHADYGKASPQDKRAKTKVHVLSEQFCDQL